MDLIVIASIAATAILGGVWRRWFGLKTPALDAVAARLGAWLPEGRRPTSARWLKLLVAVALGFMAVWPALPWWAALPVAVLLAAYWVPGHKLQEWTFGKWMLRYGPPGIWWWLAQRVPIQPVNRIVDGSFALAEILGGATAYGGAAWAAIKVAALLAG